MVLYALAESVVLLTGALLAPPAYRHTVHRTRQRTGHRTSSEKTWRASPTSAESTRNARGTLCAGRSGLTHTHLFIGWLRVSGTHATPQHAFVLERLQEPRLELLHPFQLQRDLLTPAGILCFEFGNAGFWRHDSVGEFKQCERGVQSRRGGPWSAVPLGAKR
jgi:hypothetical protein